MRRLALAGIAAAFTAACGPGDAQTPAAPAQAPATSGQPVETRAANAPGQQPAFQGQTRAPEMRANAAFEVQTFAEGLERPWGMVFLPDARLLVSEKAGRLRIVGPGGQLSEPATGLPQVDSRGQGGLLGLALDPDFATNRTIYWSYAERHEDNTTNTAVARGRLVDGAAPRVENAQVIWRQTPRLGSTLHYGSRLIFQPDGTLLVTLGERSILEGRRQAQRLDGTLGKVVRINRDGSVPADNPFRGREEARPEIFSIGHRNIQAAALHPGTGRLWVVDHGPRGGDEINIVHSGRDYGWPTITYGIEYAGGQIGEGITQREGMEQPIYYWDPSIAPSGMAFYEANLFPAWRGSLFVGALAGQHVARLTLDGERVVGEERLLTDLGERIRDVIVGPDGALYVATDNAKGRILRLAPTR